MSEPRKPGKSCVTCCVCVVLQSVRGDERVLEVYVYVYT